MAVDTRYLSHDAAAGILEIFHYDDVTDEVTIETIQNCEAIADSNKAEYNYYDERTPFGTESFHKVASIPMSLYMKWQRDGIIDYNGETDLKSLKKRLNDRDYLSFRTRPGTI